MQRPNKARFDAQQRIARIGDFALIFKEKHTLIF